MALKLSELSANPERISELMSAGQKCVHCGVKLQGSVTGRYDTPEGKACGDCYYERLGEVVES